MHKTLRLVAGYYRTASRFAVVLLLVFSLFGPALTKVQAGSTGTTYPLLPAVKNFVVEPGPCGVNYDSVGGTVLVVSNPAWPFGNWTGTISFSGRVLLVGQVAGSPGNDTVSLAPSDFTPSSLSYPSKSTANFTASGTGCFDSTPTSGGWIAASSGGKVVGNQTFASGPSGADNQMFQLVVELPLFNDTMLGVSTGSLGDKPPLLPLGAYYNFIMAVALIVLTIGAVLNYVWNPNGGEKKEKRQVGPQALVTDIAIGILVIFFFPLIYNNIAQLVNMLDQAVIAYPSPDLGAATLHINDLWSKLLWASQSSLWGAIGGGFFTIVGWIIALIVYLMSVFLGIIRILLIGVVIVAFPLSMGLKLMPFGRKLADMVDETLYGLILASLMSAIVLGVADYVVNNLGGTIFEQARLVQPAMWIAAAAIIAAVLMPTVFAPLTGVMMQTAAQTAMVAGGAATIVGGSAGLPLAGGAAAGIKAAAPALSGMMSAMASAPQTSASLKAAGIVASPLSVMGAALKHGLGQGFGQFGSAFKQSGALGGAGRNLLTMGLPAIVSAMGATQAAKVLGRMGGPPTTHVDVMRAHEVGSAVNAIQDAVPSLVPILAGTPSAVAASNDPFIVSHARARYGHLDPAARQGLATLGLKRRGMDASLANNPAVLGGVRWGDIEGQIAQNPAVAVGVYNVLNPGVLNNLNGATNRLQQFANTDAGAPDWARVGVRSGHDWADEIMRSPGRAVEHVAGHIPEFSALRNDKDLAHRVLVDRAFQPIQKDEQKLWNMYNGLNAARPATGVPPTQSAP